MKTNTSRQAYIYAALTIILWSFGATFGRILSQNYQYFGSMLIFVFALIVLGGYFLLGTGATLRSLLKQVKWQYLLFGLTGYFLYQVPFYFSLRAYDSTAEPTILNYTWPIFGTIFAGLINKSKGKSPLQRLIEGLGILLGFIAVILIAANGNLRNLQITNPVGTICGLLTGMSYGLFSAYSSTVSDEERPAFLLSALFASFICILPFGVAEGYRLRAIIRPLHILIAIISGGGLSGAAYLFWTTALAKAEQSGIGAARILSLAFILPITALLLVTLILGESHFQSGYVVVSIACIVAGSVLVQRSGVIANALNPPAPR